MDYLTKGDSIGMLKIMGIVTSYMAVVSGLQHSSLEKHDSLTTAFRSSLAKYPGFTRCFWETLLLRALYLGNATAEADMVRIAQTHMAAGFEKDPSDGPLTFLQQLLLNQKTNPAGITEREILTHAFGNISAGSDTTSTAMRSVLFNILKHPIIYERLCKEVRDNLILPVSWSAVKDLPYLSAVIKEGMRIHPSVGLILGRTVPQGGRRGLRAFF